MSISIDGPAPVGVESVSTMLAEIYAALDPINDVLQELDYRVPQIIVFGNEKAGKSTLLERIAMEPVFPTNDKVCTRIAIQLQLRRKPYARVPVIEVVDLLTHQVISSRTGTSDQLNVREIMEEISIEEEAKLRGESAITPGRNDVFVSTNKMLVIRIQSPDVPNLDLLDTPGLTTIKLNKRNERAERVLHDQVQAAKDRSMYLVILSAKENAAAQLGFGPMMSMGLTDWSIGVITKSNTMEFNDLGQGGYMQLRECIETFHEEGLAPKHGFVFTSNKPRPSDYPFSSAQDRLHDLARRELQFFESPGLRDLLESDQASVPGLLRRLSGLVYTYMERSWLPEALKVIHSEMLRLVDSYTELGLPPAHAPPAVNVVQLGELRTKVQGAARTIISDMEGNPKVESYVTTMLEPVQLDRIKAEAVAAASSIMTECQEKLLANYIVTVLQPLQAAVVGKEAVQRRSIKAVQLPTEVKSMVAGFREQLHLASTQTLSYFPTEVRRLLTDDTSIFKLGRFPQIVEHLTTRLEEILCAAVREVNSVVAVELHALTDMPNHFLDVDYDLDECGAEPCAWLTVRRRLLAASLINIYLTSAVLNVLPSWSAELERFLHEDNINWDECCEMAREEYVVRMADLNRAQEVVVGLLKPSTEVLDKLLQEATVEYMGGTSAEALEDTTEELDTDIANDIPSDTSPAAPPLPEPVALNMDFGAHMTQVGLSTTGGPQREEELSQKLLLIDMNEGGSELYVKGDGLSLLKSQSTNDSLKLIMICGQSRTGKSLLMNKLAGIDDLFRVRSSNEPCTFGVNISSSFPSASAFGGEQRSLKGRVGFLEAEGRGGDTGASYDMQSAAPMLLMSKVVIYNWKGMPARDDMLQKLNVMAEAATKICLDASDSSVVFGHLHIILRDRSNVDGVHERLLELETGRATDKALQERNATRNILNSSFESITIWGFPSPVLGAHVHDTVGAFDEKVAELKAKIAWQLRQPKYFGSRVLTGPAVAALLPLLASEINRKQTKILPGSLVKQIETRRADEVMTACRMKLDVVIEEELAAMPMPAPRLAQRMIDFKEQAMSEAHTSLADMSNAQILWVEGFINLATEALMLSNCRGAAMLATKMQQEALSHVTKSFESQYKDKTVPVFESKLVSDFVACERQALQLFDGKLNGMLEMTEVASTRADFITRLELIRNAYVSHNKALRKGVEAETAKAELIQQVEQTNKAKEKAEAMSKATKQAEERLEAARREVSSGSVPQCRPIGGGGGFGGIPMTGSEGSGIYWNNGWRYPDGRFACRAAVEAAGFTWKSPSLWIGS